MLPLKHIRYAKNLISKIIDLVVSLVSFGYFIDARYEAILIDPSEHSKICTKLFDLNSCSSSELCASINGQCEPNGTFYYIYKVGEEVLSTDYESCGTFSFEQYEIFNLLYSDAYGFKGLATFVYFMTLVFQCFYFIRKIKKEKQAHILEMKCILKPIQFIKDKMYRILIINGVFAIDFFDYISRCVRKKNEKFVGFTIFVISSNILVFFVIFAIIWRKFKFDENNRLYTISLFASFLYFSLSYPLWIVHFLGTWIAILINSNVGVDIISDFIMRKFEPGSAPVQPGSAPAPDPAPEPGSAPAPVQE